MIETIGQKKDLRRITMGQWIKNLKISAKLYVLVGVALV